MDQEKMWQLAVDQAAKQYGKGTIETLSEMKERNQGITTSTGCFQLDQRLGGSGYPKGRFIELFGPPGVGKTTMALQAVADCQSKGGRCLYIDAERKLDPGYAKSMGVNADMLFVHRPDYAEQALDVLESTVRSGAVHLVVIDSIAALCTKAAVEADMEDTFAGSIAKTLAHALPKLVGPVADTQTTVLLLNQIRMKIGVMFGNPEKTTGGQAIQFFSSVRLDVRAIGAVKQQNVVVGRRLRIKLSKNVVGTSIEPVEIDHIFGQGLDKAGELLDLAIDKQLMTTQGGWFTKSGAWYSYGDERMGQGRLAARAWLYQRPDIVEEIEQALREQHFASQET